MLYGMRSFGPTTATTLFCSNTFMRFITLLKPAFASMILVVIAGCGTVRSMNNLETGAGREFFGLWDRWVESEGDFAAATTWARKIDAGVTIEQVESALMSVAVEDNIKAVAEHPLSKELEARTGQPQRFLKVYSYCNPDIAREIVNFSPAMAAYFPCRVVLLEKEDGLWLYTLNMDMMIKMGKRLPPHLKESAMRVRDTIWKMLERGATGEF